MMCSQSSSQPIDSRSGSLADLAAPFEAPPPVPPLGVVAWVKIAAIAALFAAVNWWQFTYLFNKWRHDPNWSHGFLIPLFSLYLLYVRRDDLLSAKRRAYLPGLIIMVLGLLLTIGGFFPIRNFWVAELAMVMTLFGLVLYLCGPSVMRVAWVPVLYLVLAMPIPDRLYNQIALPLQMLAAKASGILLRLCNVDITVTALQLDITGLSGKHYPPVTVAEACSGVRSLMAFVALSVAMAFIEQRPAWHRVVLVLVGIPIAVACNILRVALTCTMYVLDKPELGQNLMHEFMGMVLLAPALGLLILVSKLLQNLYVEVDDDEPQDTSTSTGREAPQ